jgi:hypothetical protein
MNIRSTQNIPSSSSSSLPPPPPLLAKQPFFNHNLPYKIRPSNIQFFTFRNSNFSLQSKVVSLASNPHPGAPGPSDTVAQLYPQVLDSLFVAFYGWEGYGGGILTHLHMGERTFQF